MNKNKKPKMTKNDLKTAKRLMKYVTEKYKFQFILVFFCILISAVATTAVSLSLRYLLDDFILPLVGQKTPDFAGLYKALTVLGVIFLAGVIATFIYTRSATPPVFTLRNFDSRRNTVLLYCNATLTEF